MQYVIETKRLCKTYGGRTAWFTIWTCMFRRGVCMVLLGQMARVNLPV